MNVAKLLMMPVALLALPLVSAFIQQTYFFLVAARLAPLQWLLGGAAAYVLLYGLVSPSKRAFLEHFEHELGHALLALLFFRNVSEFMVNPASGSHVRHEQGFNLLIRLAPYYLPVFTLPLLLVRPFVYPAIHGPLDFFIGVTLAFHYGGLVKEFRPGQADIARSGLLASLLVTGLLNAFLLVLILSVVRDDLSALAEYVSASLHATRRIYTTLWGFLLHCGR